MTSPMIVKRVEHLKKFWFTNSKNVFSIHEELVSSLVKMFSFEGKNILELWLRYEKS